VRRGKGEETMSLKKKEKDGEGDQEKGGKRRLEEEPTTSFTKRGRV